MIERLPAALLVNGLFAGIAFAARTVSGTGVAAGVALGIGVYLGLDWRGWAVFAAFFAMGSAVTKFGYERKRALGFAEANEARRGAGRALGKGAFPALLALAAGASDSPALACAFVASTAAALADTVGTEIGTLYGRSPVLLPSFRRVPVGTEGAVSLEGTVAGLGAAEGLGGAAFGLGLVPSLGIHLVWIAPLGAFAGTLAESVLGAALERRARMGHDATNALTTGVGGIAGGLLALAVAGP